MAAFASRIVSADPQGAVQWAATISDASMRATETAAAYRPGLTPTQGTPVTWVAKSGLPDEVKAQLDRRMASPTALLSPTHSI